MYNSHLYSNIIKMLPDAIKMAPSTTFRLGCSCKKRKARSIVITTLNLSIGATRETLPSWIALK